jgi:hypothetical protein
MNMEHDPQVATMSDVMPGQDLHPGDDLYEYLREYSRQKPEVVAIWCFAVGFILGWKLKPW